MLFVVVIYPVVIQARQSEYLGSWNRELLPHTVTKITTNLEEVSPKQNNIAEPRTIVGWRASLLPLTQPEALEGATTCYHNT